MTVRVTHRNTGAPWSGCDARTMIDLVARACGTEPTKPAMIFEDGLVVTRRDFLERAERFAGWLAGRVRPGECVAIMLETRSEFMIAFFAVVAVRATLVSINPAAREHDAGHILADSNAVLAIVGSSNRQLMEGLRARTPSLRDVVHVGESEPDGLDAYGTDASALDFAAVDCRRDDIVSIYYTSGTTGTPKGCMIDHEYWLRVVDLWLRLGPMGPADRSLCCMQFYYADPAFQLMASLHTGGSLVVMRKFSVSRFWKVVADNGVTDLLTIASMPLLLMKAPPSPIERAHRVRRAVAVGIPSDMHRAMVDRFGFPWLDNYGATETGLIARVPVHLAEEMIGSGSMGVPFPEVEVRVVDEEGRDLPPGRDGEALVRAPGMFRGYLNKPEVTAEAMRGGWYHTGDIVRADERGFLTFVGRKKDMIRRSGETVAAAEVEEVLRMHPKILDAAVLAVPDEIRGEEVKAYILPVSGETPDTITPDEIIAHCAARLAAYKVPRYIEFRDREFPRTPSMRVQKDELKRGRTDLISGSWDRERRGYI